MTQEEKRNLLLRDLCARLPFEVKVKVECTTANGEKIEDEGVLNSIFINEFGTIYVCVDEIEYELEHLKPYLRSMLSMTEEEKMKLSLSQIYAFTYYNEIAKIDWLNKHHFDYRGLIDRGLAIEVTEENNPYKE